MLDSNGKYAQYHTVAQTQIVRSGQQDYSLYGDFLTQVEANQKAGLLTDVGVMAKELAVQSLCTEETLLELLTCYLSLSGALVKPASLGQDGSLISMMKNPDALFNEHFYKKAVKDEVKRQREEQRIKFEDSLVNCELARSLFDIQSKEHMCEQFENAARKYLTKVVDAMYKKPRPEPMAGPETN